MIATKVGFGTRRDSLVRSNGGGLTRTHIMWSIDQSLKRMNLDYVDLYQIHCWDNATPIQGSHSLSRVLTLSRSHSFAFSLSRVLTLSRSPSLAFSISLILTLSFSFSLSLILILTLTLSHSHSLSFSFSLILTLSNSHSL